MGHRSGYDTGSRLRVRRRIVRKTRNGSIAPNLMLPFRMAVVSRITCSSLTKTISSIMRSGSALVKFALEASHLERRQPRSKPCFGQRVFRRSDALASSTMKLEQRSVRVGRDLESMWKSRNGPDDSLLSQVQVRSALDSLGGSVYGFNLAMIWMIQEGQVDWIFSDRTPKIMSTRESESGG
jgi:hypothetical protein